MAEDARAPKRVQVQCEAINCPRLADWAYISEGGDLYLCAVHGGNEPVEGWTWIGAESAVPDADAAADQRGYRPDPAEPASDPVPKG